MITTVSVERRSCDTCGKEAYEWTRCLSCGQDLCPDGMLETALEKHGIRYPHGVSISGSGDGYYCLSCDIRLSEDKSDPLHQAYVRIRELRDERESYYKRQQAIEKHAEERITYLRSKTEGRGR